MAQPQYNWNDAIQALLGNSPYGQQQAQQQGQPSQYNSARGPATQMAPNAPGYDRPNVTLNPLGYQPAWSDYLNPDGSYHVNPLYGQSGGYGAGAPGQSGPAPLRPVNYAFDSGSTPWTNPSGANLNAPFASGAQNPVPWAGTSDADFQRALAFYNSQLPYLQMTQNAYQYGNDFNEAKRRWESEFPWTQKRDAYSIAGAAYLPSARFLSN